VTTGIARTKVTLRAVLEVYPTCFARARLLFPSLDDENRRSVRLKRMAVAGSSGLRVSVDGKLFRLGTAKFAVKGVAYGPFPPNNAGQFFASVEQTRADFAHIRELGANVLRVYHVPAKWFLDLAVEFGLKLLIDVPWNKQICFLDSSTDRADAVESVRRASHAVSRHPAVFAISVANEIAPDIVRWSGARAVENFIEDLISEVKRVDRDCLCTFTNYPPTEYLRVRSADFACFNVYLHQPRQFKNYLDRLQMLSESRPLILGEFGIDSQREGEEQKCRMLRWQTEGLFRAGLAGGVVYSYTDEWYKDGRLVEDWAMGLTTREREPKDSFRAVRDAFAQAPYFSLPRSPKVSVVVACYNGERTLKACLDSLERLHYPEKEIILVDDGSTDSTSQIVLGHPAVRYYRHEENLGLSVARNTGITAANGEIVAFTDADCRADEDWLYYLVGDLLNSPFAGIGGPNLLPPEDSLVASAVMASPGGPAHVMLTDRKAEHIPGCNMAFYKWALEQIDGFDPIFKKAGDDVDLCWRLEQAGYEIGFSPAAFVWHYRRSTIRDYLRQQHGYGEAEAVLVRKHPEYFSLWGGSVWRGRIYSASVPGVFLHPAIIYHGRYGGAGFQTLYASQPAYALMVCTSLEYHVLVTLPLWVLAVTFHYLLPLAIASLVISIGVCVWAGAQAILPRGKRRWWSRPLVAALFFLQPIVRGWARYQGRFSGRPKPAVQPNLDSMALRGSSQSLCEIRYWAEKRVDRLQWVQDLVRRFDQQGWPNKPDIGWSEFDVEIFGNRWSCLQLITVSEDHPPDRQMIRCRLWVRWSLEVRLVFWTMVALELLVLGIAANRGKWWVGVAALVISLPAFFWLMRQQMRNLQSMVTVFLDKAAKDWGLQKIGSDDGVRETPK
jgi:glycosyltransferase involved in cell wall biosynthesis